MAVFCFDRRPAGFLHKYNSLVVPLLSLSRNEQGTWEKTPGRATGLSSWPGMSDRGTTLFSGSGSLAPSPDYLVAKMAPKPPADKVENFLWVLSFTKHRRGFSNSLAVIRANP